jgi:hypothetical protein
MGSAAHNATTASRLLHDYALTFPLCFRKVALGTFPKYIGAVGDVNGPVY